MKSENQAQRRREIEDAAYAVLAEKGYKATSMLAVARRASASNETLYRWYGNKQTLFAALVASNLEDVRAYLETVIADEVDPLKALGDLAPLLISLVTGEKAIALNRAAAADVYETNSLGATIAEGGRQTVQPMVVALISAAMDKGDLASGNVKEVAETYISLVIGDLQVRRVIGVMPELDPPAIATRATAAFALFMRLFGAGAV